MTTTVHSAFLVGQISLCTNFLSRSLQLGIDRRLPSTDSEVLVFSLIFPSQRDAK